MITQLESEIAGQAQMLTSRASEGASAATKAAAVLRQAGFDHVVLAARGSSDNAARFMQYLLGAELRMLAGLATPSLYRRPARAPALGNAAVIGISQSGRSPDIVSVLAAARRQDRPTIAITNDPSSPLATQANAVIPLLAGEERSVAATKTYVASLHAMLQLIEALQPDDERRAWLDRLPGLLDAYAQEAIATRERFDPLADACMITVVGRGMALSAAFETALKIRELSGIPAEAYSPPDLLHGPIAAVDERGATWIVSVRDDPTGEDTSAAFERSGFRVAVATDRRLVEGAEVALALPADAPEWLSAILAVVPAQAAGLRLAERAGIDVDHPHGLTKVTLTR